MYEGFFEVFVGMLAIVLSFFGSPLIFMEIIGNWTWGSYDFRIIMRHD